MLKLHPTEFEVYDDEEDKYQVAKFTAFDEETFSISIEDKIISPDELRKIADMLDASLKLLKEGMEIADNQ